MNYYATQQDFLAWRASAVTSDAADDAIIDMLLEETSRFIDEHTGRSFYPRIEERLYDFPSIREPKTLMFDDDLLSLTKLTNGDGTEITNSDYILETSGLTPYWCVKLKDVSTVTWEQDSSGSSQRVLSVNGVWGYHNRYAYAWKSVTTLGAAITNTTSLTFTVSSNASFGVGSIIKIDNEICNVTALGTGTITVEFRGDNGSTAVTHLINVPVYLWQVMNPIKQACLIIANSLYQKRYGENASSSTIVTPTGLVIPPKDIPDVALAMLRPFVRMA